MVLKNFISIVCLFTWFAILNSNDAGDHHYNGNFVSFYLMFIDQNFHKTQMDTRHYGRLLYIFFYFSIKKSRKIIPNFSIVYGNIICLRDVVYFVLCTNNTYLDSYAYFFRLNFVFVKVFI